MAYVKVPAPSVVYHLAKADRLDSILDDGQIRRFEDSECWFCESLPKMKAYMEQMLSNPPDRQGFLPGSGQPHQPFYLLRLLVCYQTPKYIFQKFY